MRTDTEGSPSVAEEKSSAVPHFRSGRRSPIFAGLTNKGKVGVQRGRETVGVPSFLPPAAGAATSPPSADGESPLLRFSEKLPPVRGEPPAQFAYPGQPVLKKPRPSGANRLRSSRSPVNRCRITGEICDTTLFYYKMHPLLRQAQPPGEA